jgi:hypothetical protein
MNHLARLQLVGRVTYYLGWIAMICGALVHLKIGQSLFLALSMTKRNLFELGLVCFVICVASQLRANAPAENKAATVVRTSAAA